MSALWIAIIITATIILSVIWTRDLASGIKTAVTIVIAFVVILGAIAQLILWLLNISGKLYDSDYSSETGLPDD